MTGPDRRTPWGESELESDDPLVDDDWDDDEWDDDDGPDELDFGEEQSGGWDDDADDGTGW